MFKYLKQLHKTCVEVSSILSKDASIPKIFSYPFYFVAISISLLYNKVKKTFKKNGVEK